MTAWQLGADGVKVFPCQAVGGPAYLRHLQGPIGHIPLIPTGGITVENGRDYLRQGRSRSASAVIYFPNPGSKSIIGQRSKPALPTFYSIFSQ
jgi:2-dehydro-3-deoxyphosphogluconate aldolase/(4S)-4-hydroxy-2-oxoglutarate aldolase